MSAQTLATILFVDDSSANRLALGLILRQADYLVLEAATGEEALRLASVSKPDLVILDVNLPDLSGFEVCRRLKADPVCAYVPILLMSAVFVTSVDRTQGLEGGADAYLCKPLDPRELLATVRSLLRLYRAEEAARRAAQQWRTTFDAIRDAVCLVDADGTVVRCNKAMTDLVGRPAVEMVGRSLAEILQKALGLSEPPPFADPSSQPSTTDGKEIVLGERWFRATHDPIVDESGKYLGSVHIFRDVTERRTLEEQLRQVQKMEAIGRLAGGVAHDFNNLLTAILGNAALLQGRLPREDTSFEYVTTIERAAWRAAELTRQLLGFSRQTLLWLKPTSLNDSVEEVASLLERTIDPLITLEVRRAPDLWQVEADAGQISQVLMNLCLNARDAMPRGGRLLIETANRTVTGEHVRRHPDGRPGEHVRLRVADTGEGIPPEILPRIFDPFFTTKEPGKGTGLGLAMVFGIVQQHRGWIEVQSELGKGSCFDVYLPRLRVPKPAEQPVQPSAAAWGGRETILLADDNPEVRDLAAHFLKPYGYEVLLAEDGRQALEIYQRERARIHLVILDLTMPRLPGLEALRKLREIDPNVRVLLSSGYSNRPLGETERDGALGFVGKPYRERDLLNAVRTALDQVRTGHS
jgi:PAS domain S-box-containing protein